MPWHLVLLNSLSFFSIVIVYMALLDIAHTVPAFPGIFGLTGMNVWYMSATAAGILCFGYIWQSASETRKRSLLLYALGGNAAGLASLAAGSATPAGNVASLYAGSLLAGWLADFHPAYLPLAALLSKTAVMGLPWRARLSRSWSAPMCSLLRLPSCS